MRRLALGVDIGGTKTACALVTSAGEIFSRAEGRTPADEGGTSILAHAVALGTALIDAHDGAQGEVVTVGVGSAGVVDPERRRIIAATDSLRDWTGTELGLILDEAFELPVVTYNDVHAHALGEAFIGAGRGYQSALVAAVGTGIGGALILAGTPHTGTHGVAGHIGHLPSREAHGLRCPCGKEGHIEALSSGPGLHELFLRLGGDRTVRDSRGVFARLPQDLVAHRAVVTSAEALGRVLGGLVNALDPGVLIIAGGMIHAGDLWWESLDAGVRESALPILQEIPVVRAQLGTDAAIIGAAKAALDMMGRQR